MCEPSNLFFKGPTDLCQADIPGSSYSPYIWGHLYATSKQKEITSTLYWLDFLISQDPLESLLCCVEPSVKFQFFTRSDFLSPAWCFFSFWLWKSLFSLKPGFLHRPLRFRFHSLSLHEVRATLHIHGPAVKWEGNASSRLYNYLSHKAHSPFLGHDRCVWTPPRAWWRTLIPCPNSVMWLIWVSTSG